MKTFKLTFAATLAAMMLVAGLAAACGDKASATTASNGKGCCAKAKAACSKDGAQTASASGMGCCAKHAMTTAQVGATSDVKTCTFRPGAVAFKGTVLCNHCDLHKTETCQSMFRTDGGCLFTLAGDNAKSLSDDAKGGRKLVRVKGTVSENGELTVSTYRVVRSLDNGASAM